MWCEIPIKTTLILETEYSQKSKDRELFAEIIWRTILNNEYDGGNRSHLEYLMQLQKKKKSPTICEQKRGETCGIDHLAQSCHHQWLFQMTRAPAWL